MSSPAAASQPWTQFSYEVRFLTPAFLGGAWQDAQWRTPAFKALLRQWWRVIVWPRMNGSIAQLRAAEAELFGTVQDKPHQSEIRMRLAHASEPACTIGAGPRIQHREVKQPIGSYLYLGFGAINSNRTSLSPQSKARWDIAARSPLTDIGPALQLMAWFGTIGSRSRNAWGSLQLHGDGVTPFVSATVAAKFKEWRVIRPLAECLRQNWPAAFAADDRGPLVWISVSAFDNWEKALVEVAKLKIELRIAFPLGAPGPLEERHLFALPVSKHGVDGRKDLRWANQLRFKLVACEGKLRLLSFHLPARLEAERLGLSASGSLWERADQLRFWQEVAGKLDGNATLTRIAPEETK